MFYFQITYKFKFYVLNNAIYHVKKTITWITALVTPFISFLFNIIICICPWVSNMTHWISTKYIHFIERFGIKYSTVINNDKFNENEEDFNWWSKYYGMKYLQKVV